MEFARGRGQAADVAGQAVLFSEAGSHCSLADAGSDRHLNKVNPADMRKAALLENS